MAELQGKTGVVKISNADFAAAAKKGNTRFDNVKLDSFRTVDYIDKDTQSPRTLCIATVKIGDNGVVDGVMALSMIKLVKEMGATDLILDYTGSREYKGEETPTFDIKAKA